MNYKPAVAISIVLLILGVLVLTMCLALSGCGVRRSRVYTAPRIEHRCEDEILTSATPPALHVSPRVDNPWWKYRRKVFRDPVPVIPVEPLRPAEPGGADLYVPQSCIPPSLDDSEAEAVFAYASNDKPYLAAE